MACRRCTTIGRLPAIAGGEAVGAAELLAAATGWAGDPESSSLMPAEILAAVGLALASALLTPAGSAAAPVAAHLPPDSDGTGLKGTTTEGLSAAGRVEPPVIQGKTDGPEYFRTVPDSGDAGIRTQNQGIMSPLL